MWFVRAILPRHMAKKKPAVKSAAVKAPSWKLKPPTKEGYYWYRDEESERVLHVFDPLRNGYWKTWDWNNGRLMLCSIEGYQGDWWGPLKAPTK